jgi:hypothetical protein
MPIGALANLKTYRFSDEDITRLRAAEQDESLAAMDRYHICFALGKAFEDRKDYETSWHYYARGNAMKRAESKYRADIPRAKYPQSNPCLHTRVFRIAAWLGLPVAGPHLHPRSAARGLHTA